MFASRIYAEVMVVMVVFFTVIPKHLSKSLLSKSQTANLNYVMIQAHM